MVAKKRRVHGVAQHEVEGPASKHHAPVDVQQKRQFLLGRKDRLEIRRAGRKSLCCRPGLHPGTLFNGHAEHRQEHPTQDGPSHDLGQAHKPNAGDFSGEQLAWTNRAQHDLDDAVGLFFNDASHDVHPVHHHERQHEDAEDKSQASLPCAFLFARRHVQSHQRHVGFEREVIVVIQVGAFPDLEPLERLTQIPLHPAPGTARWRIEVKQLGLFTLHNARIEFHHAGEALGLQFFGRFDLRPNRYVSKLRSG